MARIVNQHNILQPLERETKYTIAKNKAELLKEIQYDCIAYDLRIYKNGILELEDFEISESDYILVQVIPKGGNMGSILKVVAMIGIAVLAPAFVGATGIFAEGAMLGGYGLGLSGMTAGFVAGGIILGGGLLINALLPTPTASLNLGNSNLDTSSTYSWDNSYNKSQQGTPIPKVFGTHKVTPPLIAKYIESIDDKQYFHGLYALNDGQIANVSNIKINDESIDNFDNVSVDIRYGTNDQLVIPDFATTRFDKSVSQKLSTDWDITTTESGVTELTAVIYFPRGLYYMNNNAQVVNNSVKLVVEYSADGINWTPITSNTVVNTYSEYYKYWNDPDFGTDGYYKYNSSGVYISSVSTLPYNVIQLSNGVNTPVGTVNVFAIIYAVPLSYSYPYEIITASSTSAFRKTFTKKYLTAGTYQVRARLYETPLSGSRYGSDVYFEYLEMGVNDGFIYPNTALLAIRALATDQLSGSTPVITCNITANSDNPSLIAQSILNEVSNVTSFDSTFTDFQTECNTQNYKCNIVFDANVNVRQALDLVTLNGRASIQQFGSKYAVIMDKKDVLPTQVFTFGMGNILSDTFKQSYLPINDRANIINVSYYDKDDDYKRTVVEISNTTFDNVTDRKVSELNLIGCVDRNQAVKHANYQLKCNRYLSETVQFEAFHDSLVCKYGDIVGISHDLPQYGYSGRIVSCNSTTIVLDNPVTFTVGKTYVILLRNKNNQIQEITVTGTGTTNTLTISGTLSYTFAQYDNYMFGETNKAYKLFRVVQIATGTDLTRQITCIEYNSNVYDDGSTVNVPIISDLGLKSLFISDYIRYKQNTNEIETVVNLKWTGASLKYKIYLDNKFIANSNDTYFDYITNITGNHTFKIVDTNGKSISQIYNILGKLAKPNAVTSLSYSLDCDELSLSWGYNDKPIDFKQFEIYNQNGELLATSLTNGLSLPIIKKSINYSVYARDTSNILSDVQTVNVNIPYLSNVENFTTYFNKNGEIELSWTFIVATCNPIQYEIRKGISWEKAQIVANTYDKFYKPNGQGTYFIKAKHKNIYGFENTSETAASLTISGSNIVQNVIFTADEKETSWGGIKTNVTTFLDGVYGNCLILNPASNDVDTWADVDTIANVDYPNGSLTYGIYELSTHSISLSTSQRLGIDFNYQSFALDLTNDVDSWLDVDSIIDVDGDLQGAIKIIPQIKVNSGSWQNYVLGDYVGSLFEFRLIIETSNANAIPLINECKIVADVPDKVQQGTNISVGTSGLNVIYAESFNTDTVNVQITIINSQSGDYAVITNSLKTGFTINIKNGASNVARNINWLSQGY